MAADTYYVILPKIEDAKKDAAKEELASLFAIMKSTARKILDSAPIVLLDDATAEEAELIRSRFNGTSDLNLKLDIRQDKTPGVQTVRWGSKRPSLRTGSAPAAKPASPASPAEPAPGVDLYKESLQDEDDPYTYSVFLSTIGSATRKEKATEALMDIRSLSREEAVELCDRTVIPAIKGASKAEAEVVLKRFVSLRIFGCITKRPKG